MKRNSKLQASLVMTLLIAVFVLSPTAQAQDPDAKSAETSIQKEYLNNKKFTFSFSGQSTDGDAIVAIGWFQTDENGNVVAGHAESSYNLSGGITLFSRDLSTTSNSFLLVFNEQDNIFRLVLIFGDNFPRLIIDQMLFLDDSRGLGVRMSGQYNIVSASPTILGVGSGQFYELVPSAPPSTPLTSSRTQRKRDDELSSQ